MPVTRKQLAASILFLFLYASTISAQKVTVAVVDLEGIGISQVEAVALSNRLRNELFRLGTFKVVDRGLMQNILAEQDLQQTGCTSNECLVELGRLLGVQLMIGGSISKIENMFSVSTRVVDVETGEVISVSDYDREAGLSEILTTGMAEVAATLSKSQRDENLSDAAVPDRVTIDQIKRGLEETSPEQSTNSPSDETGEHEATRWTINAGIASTRNTNLMGITWDVFQYGSFSAFITGGIGFHWFGSGVAYQQNLNEKGFLFSLTAGIVDGWPNGGPIVAYQWRLAKHSFLVVGLGSIFDLDDGMFDFIYPVLSYEFRR